MPALPASPAVAIDRRVVAAVLLGTVLNHLNSSMIAVAVLRIQDAFAVGVLAGSWLISSFYLVTAVGQSVLGRLADQFGPRRLLCVGFLLVGAAGALGPLAPSFGWLVAARVLLAVGTAAGFPAGLALLRRAAGGQAPPPAVLAAVTVAGSSITALGPALGGSLVTLAGWEAIFVVNVAVAIAGLALALRWLPADEHHAGGVGLGLVRRLVDGRGIALFATALGALLAFVLSLPTGALWWLLPVALAAGAALVPHGRRHADPFLDVGALLADRPLLGVCAQYLAVNAVAFGVYFAVPLWLEAVRGFHPGEAGALMVPLAGLGVVGAPIAARVVARAGIRPALLVAAVAMVLSTLLLATFDGGTPVWAILAIGALLGVPIGFNNLALQSALYAVSDPERTGAAAGLFQTCRFVGAVAATSLLGVCFADGVTTEALRAYALGLAALSAVVLAATLRRRG